jgi:hypothetical protein
MRVGGSILRLIKRIIPIKIMVQPLKQQNLHGLLRKFHKANNVNVED